MDNKKYVELNAFQVASYWIVKRIKNLAEEINNDPNNLSGTKRGRFGEIFDYSKLKNAGYRKLYVELAKKIEERCVSKNSRKFSIRMYSFNQGHNDLTKWLSEIVEEKVPDINLCSISAPDVLLQILMEQGSGYRAFVGDVEASGVRNPLPTKYLPNAVLCGPVKKVENEENSNDGDKNGDEEPKA